MGTAIKHPVPDRVKPSFVIFDIRALWRSGLSVRVPGCQKSNPIRLRFVLVSVWYNGETNNGIFVACTPRDPAIVWLIAKHFYRVYLRASFSKRVVFKNAAVHPQGFSRSLSSLALSVILYVNIGWWKVGDTQSLLLASSCASLTFSCMMIWQCWHVVNNVFDFFSPTIHHAFIYRIIVVFKHGWSGFSGTRVPPGLMVHFYHWT